MCTGLAGRMSTRRVGAGEAPDEGTSRGSRRSLDELGVRRPPVVGRVIRIGDRARAHVPMVAP